MARPAAPEAAPEVPLPGRHAAPPAETTTESTAPNLDRITRRDYHRDVREGGRSMRGIIIGIVFGVASWAMIAAVAFLILR